MKDYTPEPAELSNDYLWGVLLYLSICAMIGLGFGLCAGLMLGFSAIFMTILGIGVALLAIALVLSACGIASACTTPTCSWGDPVIVSHHHHCHDNYEPRLPIVVQPYGSYDHGRGHHRHGLPAVRGSSWFSSTNLTPPHGSGGFEAPRIPTLG